MITNPFSVSCSPPQGVTGMLDRHCTDMYCEPLGGLEFPGVDPQCQWHKAGEIDAGAWMEL